MSKILDLAKNFEQTSNEQAKHTEQTVADAFKNHEKHLIGLLNENEKAISNAIQEQNKRILPIMLKTWSVVAIAIITAMLVTGLTLAWQGKKIRRNLEQIAQQNQQDEVVPPAVADGAEPCGARTSCCGV